MTIQEAVQALGVGLVASGMTAEQITQLGAASGRGLKMLAAIAKRAEAAALTAQAGVCRDEAMALEQAAQTGE